MHALHACMHVCMYACVYVCMYVCIYACMHVCMYACVHVRMYLCICVCVYVWVGGWVGACMHACICFLNSVSIHIYIHGWKKPCLTWTKCISEGALSNISGNAALFGASRFSSKPCRRCSPGTSPGHRCGAKCATGGEGRGGDIGPFEKRLGPKNTGGPRKHIKRGVC